MNRTITVTGTGRVSLTPDMTAVSMTIRTLDKDYDASMEKAAASLAAVQEALAAVGFERSALKTAGFNVSAEHESVQKDGRYVSVFVGYACVHSLCLEFAFDTQLLSRVLSAIASCVADPELTIRFTVKDKEGAGEKLLASAAENAKRKAQILASASGVKLGALVSIQYGWSNKEIYSNTSYRMENKCMAMASRDMAFTPEDIELTDNASFVWEME